MARKETPFEVSFAIDLENKVNGKIVGKSNPEKKSPRWNRSERLLNEGRGVGHGRAFNKLGNFIKFHPSSFCILCQPPPNYAPGDGAIVKRGVVSHNDSI